MYEMSSLLLRVFRFLLPLLLRPLARESIYLSMRVCGIVRSRYSTFTKVYLRTVQVYGTQAYVYSRYAYIYDIHEQSM